MPSSELMLEYAADRVEPIPDLWHMFGTIASMYHSTHKDKNDKPTKPSDWIPRITYKPKTTIGKMKSALKNLRAAMLSNKR